MRDDNTNGVMTRRRLAVVVHASLAAALVPGFMLLAAPTHWTPLVGVLAVLAVVCDFHDVPLPGGLRFDAGIALALITVATAGPLAAFLVVGLLPMLVAGAVRRQRLWRAGNLANVAAYGWEAIAAAAVLRVGGSPVLVALLGAGAAQALVNLGVGPMIYATLWVGRPPVEVARMLAGTLPAAVVMLTAGALTAMFVPIVGVAALAAFAAIAVVPQSALTIAAEVRPVAQLDRATATRRYAHALAVQLGLSRAERRHVQEVAAVLRRSPPTGEPMGYIHATLRDSRPAVTHAQLLAEWWDGGGRPLGLRHDAIPMATRILAVADTWSALTARSTPGLSHEEALADLQAAAGRRLDPDVVRAARAVVAEERVTAIEPAPEPRLHRFRVPAPLRRALATG